MKKMISVRRFLFEVFLLNIGLNILVSIIFIFLIVPYFGPLLVGVSLSSLTSFLVGAGLGTAVVITAIYIACRNYVVPASAKTLALWFGGINLLLSFLGTLINARDDFTLIFSTNTLLGIVSALFAGGVAYVALRTFSPNTPA